MNKKFGLLTIFVLFGALIFAQQITRVAVVDTDRIYSTFRKDSQSAREYEKKKELYQKKIVRMQEEILQLRQKKVDAQAENKSDAIIKRYEALIASKTSFLTEYTSTKNSELKSLRRRLLTSNQFYTSLYEAIKKVAETEGYTVVFTLQESLGIIWYSSTIDITDMVINSLSGLQ